MEPNSAAVRSALCRVLRVLRVFGVAPFHFTRRHTVTIVCEWKAQLYYGYFLSTILNIVNILAIVTNFTSNGKEYKYRTMLWKVVLSMNFICTMLISSMVTYGARKRTKYLFLQLNHLNKITVLYPNDSITLRDLKQILTTSVGILVLLSASVFDFGMLMLNATSVISLFKVLLALSLSAFYVQRAIVLLLEMQILLVIYMMRRAVQSYNCELERLLELTERGDYRNDAILFKLKESLWRLGRYYLTLCETVRRMNSREGSLLLLLVLFLTMQLMDNSYRLILAIRYIGGSTDQCNALNRYSWIHIRLFWSVVYVIYLGALVNTCDTVLAEIQKMQLLLSELMYRSRGAGKTITEAAGALCEHLLVHQPMFKPLCICAITRSMFITVISGVVTYLVSVIKFHIMEEKKA